MKVVGIISEYNPFHLGHAYQIRELRKQTKADIVLILMSGNVVQRGEFAIVDKWSRAQAALAVGADLVLELPLLASLQSADYFAEVSIQILSALKVDCFGFGTESATTNELVNLVDWQNSVSEQIDVIMQVYLKQGLSYAATYQKALDDLYDEEWDFNSSSPNHLLGLQYIKKNQELAKPMEPVAIQRINALDGKSISSGRQIRKKWYDTKDPLELAVPEAMRPPFTKQQTVQWADYYPLLEYQLGVHPPERLSHIFGVREGIEFLLVRKGQETSSFDELVDSLTSKRWTKASIQRILMGILLNITKTEWKTYQAMLKKSPLLRVLGFSPSGRAYLNQYKKHLSIDLFSNLSQNEAQRYALMLRADNVLRFNSQVRIPEQNMTRFPIIWKEEQSSDT